MLLHRVFLQFVRSKIFRFALVINLILALSVAIYSRPQQTFSSKVLLKIFKHNSANSTTFSFLSGSGQGLSPEAAAYRSSNKKSLYRLLNGDYDYFNLDFAANPTALHDSIIEDFIDEHLNVSINNSSNEVIIEFKYKSKDSLNSFMSQYCQFISDSVVDKEINSLQEQLNYLNAENKNIQSKIIEHSRELSLMLDQSNSIQLQTDITPIKLLEKQIKLMENQLNIVSEQMALKKTEIALYNQEIFFDYVHNFKTQIIKYSLVRKTFEYFFYFSLITVLLLLMKFLINDRS